MIRFLALRSTLLPGSVLLDARQKWSKEPNVPKPNSHVSTANNLLIFCRCQTQSLDLFLKFVRIIGSYVLKTARLCCVSAELTAMAGNGLGKGAWRTRSDHP
jgi:hypothetical protein